MKPYYDAAIIIPLNEEFEQALTHFKFEEDLSTESQLRFRVTIDDKELRILLVKQEIMGRTSAQTALFALAEQFDVGLAICLGIAGALSSDLNIGDVCYSKEVVDVLDNAKISQTRDGKDEISFWPTYYSSPIDLITAINRNRYNPDFRKPFDEWRDAALAQGQKLIPDKFHGKKNTSRNHTKADDRRGANLLRRCMRKSDIQR